MNLRFNRNIWNTYTSILWLVILEGTLESQKTDERKQQNVRQAKTDKE